MAGIVIYLKPYETTAVIFKFVCVMTKMRKIGMSLAILGKLNTIF